MLMWLRGWTNSFICSSYNPTILLNYWYLPVSSEGKGLVYQPNVTLQVVPTWFRRLFNSTAFPIPDYYASSWIILSSPGLYHACLMPSKAISLPQSSCCLILWPQMTLWLQGTIFNSWEAGCPVYLVAVFFRTVFRGSLTGFEIIALV